MYSRLRLYRVKVYGRPSDKVVFFFCPFGLRRWQFNMPGLPIHRLRRAGFQVVCYDFASRFTRLSAAHMGEVVEAVAQDVTQQVRAYQKEGVIDLHAYGISMGTIYAAYATAHISAIKSVVLNLSYADIPRHIIEFPHMVLAPRRASERVIKGAGGEEGLRQVLGKYSPLDYAEKLSRKRVLLYLARNDRVMKYPNTSQLKAALESLGTELWYEEDPKRSHYWAAFRNNVRAKVYLSFLAKK